MELERLGWNDGFAEAFAPHAEQGLAPGRVAVEHRGVYVVYTASGETWAEITGRMRHQAQGLGDLPAVGDWVALRTPVTGGARAADGRATIHSVLPRASKFSRKEAGGRTQEQVLCANVDVTFVVTAMTRDLNPRRLERYLATAWEGGTTPVVVLTKADLCEDRDAASTDVESAAVGVPVHVTSCVTGEGVGGLGGYFSGHRTVALLGSSGVGKSSLINRLCGDDRQDVREIRADGRGRHTTTRRELVILPGGGLIVDTPGMRELQLWETADGLDETFDDVVVLGASCRFNDCTHQREPGCAVREAIDDGRLDSARLASYRKLEREVARLELRQDKRAAAEQRKRRKQFSKAVRSNPKPRW